MKSSRMKLVTILLHLLAFRLVLWPWLNKPMKAAGAIVLGVSGVVIGEKTPIVSSVVPGSAGSAKVGSPGGHRRRGGLRRPEKRHRVGKRAKSEFDRGAPQIRLIFGGVTQGEHLESS